MRDLLVTLIVFGSIPYILRRPHVGILVWSWIGYMNPHRLTWGFAYSFPFAQVVAIATFISLIYTKESRKIPINGLTVLWFLLLIWMVITTLFAFYPDDAMTQLIKVLKIQLVTFMTLMVFNSKERIFQLLWVITLSIGFFGIKGGIFTLSTGGSHRVWGPPGSFIEDNNSLGLALLMILPLFRYLQLMSSDKRIRWFLVFCMVTTGIATIGTYSRGAYLAGASVILFLWLKGRNKLVTAMLLLLLIPVSIAFMPEQWHSRMATISTYHEDGSAMGRLQAWSMTINLASQRLTGGGFESWTQPIFDLYGYGHKARAAHSIYFSFLGDHGWIGLALFIGILVGAWRTGSWIIRHGRHDSELSWATELARMIQVSLVAYATGGAFLSMAYFDLFWHLVAILILTKLLVRQHLEQRQRVELAGAGNMRLSLRGGNRGETTK